MYSYPRILKLIESAYLAISVLDREGNVVAFAAFEDYPQGMRGMIDDRHFNHWEHWFHNAFGSNELTAMNTLWLSYFVAGGTITYRDQIHPFKKILQTVYSSMAEIIGILFLSSKYYTLYIISSISIHCFDKNLDLQQIFLPKKGFENWSNLVLKVYDLN